MLKQLLINGLQVLPSDIFQRLVKTNSNIKIKKIARAGVKNRDVTIQNGVGAGLKFNCGESNPDGALGIYEPPVQETLANHLKPGDIFYDIGANVGFFTIIVAKLVGETGKVYAFEPAPYNAKLLRKNIELNKFNNVTVIEKAVAESSQKGELVLGDYCGGNVLANFFTGIESTPKKQNSVSVDVICIDDLVENQTINPPNMVKIDVEGGEINVIQGMMKIINNHKPILLYEIDDRNKRIFQEKMNKIDSFVSDLGYTLKTLEDAYPDIGWNVGHVIAIPKHS